MAEPYRPKLQPWRATRAGVCANCGGTLQVEEIPLDPTTGNRYQMRVACAGCGNTVESTAQPWHKLTLEEAQARRREKAIKGYNDHWGELEELSKR